MKHDWRTKPQDHHHDSNANAASNWEKMEIIKIKSRYYGHESGQSNFLEKALVTHYKRRDLCYHVWYCDQRSWCNGPNLLYAISHPSDIDAGAVISDVCSTKNVYHVVYTSHRRVENCTSYISTSYFCTERSEREKDPWPLVESAVWWLTRSIGEKMLQFSTLPCALPFGIGRAGGRNRLFPNGGSGQTLLSSARLH